MKFQSFPISGEVYLIGYFIALGLSISITLLLIKVPFKFTLNQPSKGKNVKSFGGVPVVLSFLITLWLFQLIGVIDSRHISLLTVITASTGTMMILGIYDDITQCTARLKLTVQILIACILYKCGFQIERIGDLVELGNFSILLTKFPVISR